MESVVCPTLSFEYDMNTGFCSSKWSYLLGLVGDGIRRRRGTRPFRFDVLFDDALYADARFAENDYFKNLNSKLFASWVLARLRSLDPESIREYVKEYSDGGGYTFEFCVTTRDDGTVIADGQLQGDPVGVVLLGYTSDQQMADAIVKDLVEVLAESPQELAHCCYQIVNPEWQTEPGSFQPQPDDGTTNDYGWNGESLLGIENTEESY